MGAARPRVGVVTSQPKLALLAESEIALPWLGWAATPPLPFRSQPTKTAELGAGGPVAILLASCSAPAEMRRRTSRSTWGTCTSGRCRAATASPSGRPPHPRRSRSSRVTTARPSTWSQVPPRSTPCPPPVQSGERRRSPDRPRRGPRVLPRGSPVLRGREAAGRLGARERSARGSVRRVNWRDRGEPPVRLEHNW